MLSDGYVKYEEAEVYRSAIMQDIRDNEKKKIKMADWQPFLNFTTARFVMGYPCVRHHILFYIHVPAFCFFFLVQSAITKLIKFKMATKRLF